ncbi:hypothetical protein [Prevotella melaninogenica]
MKTLNLIIKQCYFDEIIKGTKKQEFREVKPTTFKRLVQLDEDGYELEDENGNAIPIQYDALQLYVGYAKNRASALVEVKSAHCEIVTDEKGEPIIYECGTDEKGEPLVWVVEQVVYNLGKVLAYKPKGQ